ncbi:mesothelin-like protein [Myripristis murdjan]|uniref:mesothelin-like protein n=1 Tax=Myripristis murdjan TaxID=586833 RepID=UPI0011763759|nr:mesothelin-like protein [Myripristis murdjan]
MEHKTLRYQLRVKPEMISTALASNFETITEQTIENLGSASAGLTTNQISSAPPSVLVSSLSTLSTVSTWNQQQASTIIQTITAGGFQISSASSLQSLGTLVGGLPSSTIQSIAPAEILTTSQSTSFVSNMLAAPQIVQETYVNQIIAIDQSPASVVQNVPDAMASQIPLSLLLFSAETVDVSVINKKTWKQDQAIVLFDAVASTSFNTEELSPSVLQGFSCSSIQGLTTRRIQSLVFASRNRQGRAKVVFKETQLTCMYNLLRGNLSQKFTDYPSDMLLYFGDNNVDTSNCRSYFTALGAADFTVLSSVLNRESLLLNNARSCLGISGVSLSRNNVEVLGNMACTLQSSYIESSDPLILEKLKACKNFSGSQVTAMETLLLSGKTRYGNTTTWNLQTLKNLGTLPLYLTNNFWVVFRRTVKKRFLKSFMPQLRREKVQKRKLKALFKQISVVRTKRGAGCTVGNITHVTISDPSFPFGYDSTQFDLCLDVPVVKNNLNTITEKVDDDDFQKVILVKLNQAYPSSIPDEQVQLLRSVSRVALLNDIFKWNVTRIDTLAALMDSNDGPWAAAESKEIITKYLSVSGNSLGSSELNAIGSNLCSLNTSTLRTITPDSIRNANPVDVASCSAEQKRVLYEIRNSSLSSQSASPTAYYHLISPYLGGAPLSDIVALSAQNISMDIATFQNLDPDVINNLTVSQVRNLIGNNLPDLKMFENVTAVNIWVNLQQQSDLDTLGLGLVTSRVSNTPTITPQPTTPTTQKPTTQKPTIPQPTTPSTPQPTTPTTPQPTTQTTQKQTTQKTTQQHKLRQKRLNSKLHKKRLNSKLRKNLLNSSKLRKKRLNSSKLRKKRLNSSKLRKKRLNSKLHKKLLNSSKLLKKLRKKLRNSKLRKKLRNSKLLRKLRKKLHNSKLLKKLHKRLRNSKLRKKLRNSKLLKKLRNSKLRNSKLRKKLLNSSKLRKKLLSSSKLLNKLHSSKVVPQAEEQGSQDTQRPYAWLFYLPSP